jgi:hypothetical protein
MAASVLLTGELSGLKAQKAMKDSTPVTLPSSWKCFISADLTLIDAAS